MSALSESRQRLIERQLGMTDETGPDVVSARERLRRAAHAVDAEFSPANLLRHELERHPYLTIAAAVGAGASTALLSRRASPVARLVMNSGLVPIATRYALVWLLRVVRP